MGECGAVAQECGIEVAAADSCSRITGLYRHALAQEQLLDITALLRTDINTCRFDCSREEMGMCLLPHVQTIAAYERRSKDDEYEGNMPFLSGHSASSFLCIVWLFPYMIPSIFGEDH